MSRLELENPNIKLKEGKKLLNDINLSVKSGELHVIMSPKSLNIRELRATTELLRKTANRVRLGEEHLKRETYVGFSEGEDSR